MESFERQQPSPEAEKSKKIFKRFMLIGMTVNAALYSGFASERYRDWRALETDLRVTQEQLMTLAEQRAQLDNLFGKHGITGQLAERIHGLEEAKDNFSVFHSTYSHRRDTPLFSEGETVEQEIETTPLPARDLMTHDELQITPEHIIDVLQSTYPKGWIHGDVASITFDADDTGEIPEQYGRDVRGHAVARFGRGQEGITFTAASSTQSVAAAFRTLSHEIGHGNDWESDADMTINERAELLLKVAERLSDDDRFLSSYVESISNEDEQLERYTKAVEYWAEICDAYFSYPEGLHIKDFELVDSHIKKTDPTFDPQEAAEKRLSTIIDIHHQNEAS